MQVIKTKKGVFYREKLYLDGKAIHSPRFQRKTDAVQWKARMTSEKGKYLSSGVLPKTFQEIAAVTLNEHALYWLETRVKLQLAVRTYEQYSNVLKKHILPKYGKLNLSQIQLAHGHKLIQELQENGHNARGVNLILSIFKSVLIEAVKDNKLDKNPFQFLREMKQAPKSDVFMNQEEIKKILETSKGHYFYSLFVIAINTGMRRGEIAGLCWDKVNFDTSLMEISRLRDRNGLGDRTKTFKSRRFIPMNAVVKTHLLELKKTSKTELVVVDENDQAFDVNHLFRTFKRILRKTGIKNHFRFHDLRHSFASHFMMNGGNIYDLQKILGHTSLEMTQRYAHLAPEHLVMASNVVSFGANQKPALALSATI